MSNFLPKGRRSISDQLLQFGVHLVYMEGTRTEPYYVDNIKNRIAAKYSCKPNDIAIIKGSNDKKSRHTVELVNFALNDVKKRLKKNHTINHVWIFFDKDRMYFERRRSRTGKGSNGGREIGYLLADY